MSRFFGSKKDEVPPPSLGDVSTTLGQRIQQLDQKIAHLDNQLLQCRSQMEQAKSAPMKDRVRKRAGQLLRERKMYENQREQLAGSQWNVEQTDFNIQMAKDTTTQMEALRSAQTTMKEQMKAMNLTDVYAMQDEMEDMFDMQNEIQEVMARSFAVPEDIDDADLDAGRFSALELRTIIFLLVLSLSSLDLYYILLTLHHHCLQGSRISLSQ